jgi:two-component system cell cycle sensor histidine kinase/response regulator CckA
MISVAAGEIVHALVNVIKNAVEAMPSGGLLIIEGEKVEISQEHSEKLLHLPPGQYIRFSITDTGTGIPVEHIDKIFEPFFSTKERKTGTGLGLSMVYAAVREHGGEVRVYSEPGSGTIFRIYLPIGESPRTQETETGTRSFGPPDPSRLVGLKVLVLEDEESIKNFLEDSFTRKGSIVEVVNTIADFRKTLGETGFLPDVVILDMVLPDGSGATLIKDIKAKLPRVKIIAVSGYSGNGQAHLMVDEGAHIFLQKPFNATQLMEAVQSVMSMGGETGNPGEPA